MSSHTLGICIVINSLNFKIEINIDLSKDFPHERLVHICKGDFSFLQVKKITFLYVKKI